MYRRYKIGPKETLNTLQSLYERHKVVTYPRTDSNYLTTDMVDTMKKNVFRRRWQQHIKTKHAH